MADGRECSTQLHLTQLNRGPIACLGCLGNASGCVARATEKGHALSGARRRAPASGQSTTEVHRNGV
eukprot:5297405-Prymnesium_polylepis.2